MPEGEAAVIMRGNEILWQRSKLPTEYQEVAFLRATGEQWIDTGYAFVDDFAWEIIFEDPSTGGTLFGGRTSATRTAVLYYGNAQNNNNVPFISCSVAAYNGNTTPFKLGALSKGRHVVKMSINKNKGSAWVDGVKMYNDTPFSGGYISGVTQGIFADNYGNGKISEYSSSKVYGLKMWQGEILVRNFVPCYRKTDGKPGMYDIAGSKFYENSGSGEFMLE